MANCLLCSDNGIGFDMAYADKLFGALTFTRCYRIPGTGIGLARCSVIHWGQIWAERVNQGTTFYFILDEKESA